MAKRPVSTPRCFLENHPSFCSLSGGAQQRAAKDGIAGPATTDLPFWWVHQLINLGSGLVCEVTFGGPFLVEESLVSFVARHGRRIESTNWPRFNMV